MNPVATVAQGDKVGRVITAAKCARNEVMDISLSVRTGGAAVLTPVLVPGENHSPRGLPLIY
jgi:hypothetical protein